MSGARNPITSTVPFDTDGVHHGFLRLPASRETSAWGSVMIPITVIRNGQGPTALLTGANHGDEYEGPIALQSLCNSLPADRISGRVIIVPFMNQPAFAAGRRTSPLDGMNLNRVFPGAPDGSPTQKIADYFIHFLVPRADFVLDYHSGGKSLDFIPFAAAHLLDDKAQEERCIAAMEAFNAPYSMKLKEIDNVGMYDTAVEESGKVFVSTELGGGGTATARSAWIAIRGARNLLIHAGILDAKPDRSETVRIDTTDDDCFYLAENSGLFEIAVDLGEQVEADQVIARIWSTERTGCAPTEIRSRNGGILAARHFPGLVGPGDCIAVVAQTLGE